MIGLKTKNTVSECLYFLFIMSIQCTYYFTGAISIPIKLALELILVVLKRKIKVNLFVKWAILMVVIAATSGIFSGYNDYTIDALFKVLMAYSTGIVVLIYNTNIEQINRTFKYLIIGGATYFLMVFFSQGPMDVLSRGVSGAYTNGTSINYTYISIPVAILAAWIVSRRRSFSTGSVFFILLLMNFVSGKRKASLIPVLALVLFYIFRNGINLKLKVIGRLVCGLIAFWGFIAFSVSNGWAYKTYGYRIYGLLTYLGNNADLTDGSVKSLMTRSSLASIAKDNIVHNFPFPIGVGNFASLSTYPHAHNNYFELLLTLGILGFLCYYAMFFYITRKAWKVRKRPEGVFVIVYVILTLILDFSTTSYWNLVSVAYIAIIYSIVNLDENETDREWLNY